MAKRKVTKKWSKKKTCSVAGRRTRAGKKKKTRRIGAKRLASKRCK